MKILTRVLRPHSIGDQLNHWFIMTLAIGVVALLGVWHYSTGGNAQTEKVIRGVELGSESTAVINSPLMGAQTAIISCLDLTSQSSPVSSSTAVVIPAPMDMSIAHEAVATNRFDRIMFTVNATNRTNIGVRLTLVNRLAVNLTCDVFFLQ